MPANPLDRARTWARFLAGLSSADEIRLTVSALLRHRSCRAPDDLWRRIDSFEGYLNAKEAGLLHWAAREWPVEGPVLELGSFEGRSTGVFAAAGRRVFAVDAWTAEVRDVSAFERSGESPVAAEGRFRANLEAMGIAPSVEIHRGLTRDVGRTWKTPGAILFIDAGHTYEDVSCDLEAWTPHLLPGGLLLMHDVLGDSYPGVLRAAAGLLHRGWRVVASAGSLVGFVKAGAR